MQVMELNLASRPFKNDTILWVGFLCSVLLLVWWSWWNVQTYRDHHALLASLQESNTGMRARFADLDRRDDKVLREIDGFDLPKLWLRSDKANEVIRWKSFSWTKLFNQLETIQPWDVQMTSVHPVFRAIQGGARGSIEDPDQVPVSVEGVAKNLKEYFKFQRALIFDPHFDRVDPANTATDEHSGETVFRLRFLYDPRVVVEAEDETLLAETPPVVEDATADAASNVTAEPLEVADTESQVPEPGPMQVAAEPVDGLATDDSLERISRKGRRNERAEGRPPADTADESPDLAAPETAREVERSVVTTDEEGP